MLETQKERENGKKWDQMGEVEGGPGKDWQVFLFYSKQNGEFLKGFKEGNVTFHLKIHFGFWLKLEFQLAA